MNNNSSPRSVFHERTCPPCKLTWRGVTTLSSGYQTTKILLTIRRVGLVKDLTESDPCWSSSIVSQNDLVYSIPVLRKFNLCSPITFCSIMIHLQNPQYWQFDINSRRRSGICVYSSIPKLRTSTLVSQTLRKINFWGDRIGSIVTEAGEKSWASHDTFLVTNQVFSVKLKPNSQLSATLKHRSRRRG